MSKIDIEELLDRYLKGETSSQETEQVEAWLNSYQNPGSGWQQMDRTSKDKWLAGLFQEIEATAGVHERKVMLMRPQRHLWLSVAAVAAMLTVFFSVYLAWPLLQSRLQTVRLTVLYAPVNQKKQVVLADGSTVRLNSNSQIKYSQAFSGKIREVYLSGEAYFDINHDAARPFIIHTGKVITTVLGTAFNIKEDSQLHSVTVTVTRGKVSVANGSEVLGTITPNQQISFNSVSRRHIQTNVDARQAIAWQESDLHFDDITFADAAAQLQQRFKVRISFANGKVKNCRFTGTALKGEKLGDILKVICAFNNAAYKTKSDGSIIIDGQGCN